MDQLQAFAKKWSRRRFAGKCWLGEISDVRASKRPVEIARRAGFVPANDFLPSTVSAIVAARALSYGMHESIAYGQRRYRESKSRDLVRMFEELGADAQFWASEPYGEFAAVKPASLILSAGRLTNATFEVGVMAANDKAGFIWWRTEED